MAKLNEGEQLEYRMQRLFFYEGYFTRRSIDLYPEVADGQKVTDVDVLGLAFGPSLQPILLIGECKTTRSSSEEMDRLLWLRGMVHFLDASIGFFAKTSLSPQIKGFARHLDLLAFDDQRINQREHDLNIHDRWLGSHNPEFMHRLLSQTSSIAKQHPDINRLSRFLMANFWWQDNFDRLKKTCSAISKIGELYERAKEPEHKLIVRGLYFEAVILLTVSLLYAAHRGMELTNQEFQRLVTTNLSSGIGNPKDFKKLSSVVNNFVRETIRLETGHYPTKEMPSLQLQPPAYTSAIINLMERLLHQSESVRELPRFQDVLFYEYLHQDRPIDWAQLIRMFPNNGEMLLKQTQNILHFAGRQLDAPKLITDEILRLFWSAQSPDSVIKDQPEESQQQKLPLQERQLSQKQENEIDTGKATSPTISESTT